MEQRCHELILSNDGSLVLLCNDSLWRCTRCRSKCFRGKMTLFVIELIDRNLFLVILLCSWRTIPRRQIIMHAPRTEAQIRIQKRTHICTHTHTHTHTHTRIHTRTNTHARTHAHTCINDREYCLLVNNATHLEERTHNYVCYIMSRTPCGNKMQHVSDTYIRRSWAYHELSTWVVIHSASPTDEDKGLISLALAYSKVRAGGSMATDSMISAQFISLTPVSVSIGMNVIIR